MPEVIDQQPIEYITCPDCGKTWPYDWFIATSDRCWKCRGLRPKPEDLLHERMLASNERATINIIKKQIERNRSWKVEATKSTAILSVDDGIKGTPNELAKIFNIPIEDLVAIANKGHGTIGGMTIERIY